MQVLNISLLLIASLLPMNPARFYSPHRKRKSDTALLIAQQDSIAQPDANDSLSPSLSTLPAATPSRFSFSQFDPLQILVGAFLKLFVEDPDLLRVGKSTLATVIYTYIAVSIAGTFGVDTKAILSLLSISGLTFGLAIQNVLSQIFAGLFLVVFCPFKRGWVITVDNYTGKVLSVDTRYEFNTGCLSIE